VRVLQTASALAFLACGVSRLPAPPYAAQQSSAYNEVPYPPPPARVEFVPVKPKAAAVWIDGEWTWEGRRWAWNRGRWVVPSPGEAFSPWTSTRDENGVYWVAAGTWRDGSGRETAAPPVLAYGSPSGGTVVNVEGEPIPPGPVVHEEVGKQLDGGIVVDAAPDVFVPENDASPLADAGGGR
jgi:hypothetical protein